MAKGIQSPMGNQTSAALTRGERVGYPWMASCCRDPCHAVSHPPATSTSHQGRAVA